MKPEDRLIINYTPEKAHRIEELDWHLVTGNVLSGFCHVALKKKKQRSKIKRK